SHDRATDGCPRSRGRVSSWERAGGISERETRTRAPWAGRWGKLLAESGFDKALFHPGHVLPCQALGQLGVAAADSLKDCPVLGQRFLRAPFNCGGTVLEQPRDLDESLQRVDQLLVVAGREQQVMKVLPALDNLPGRLLTGN